VLLYLLFLLVVVIAGLEIVARYIPGWNQWVNLIGNPDHRIPANSAPDINSDGIRSRVEAEAFKEEDFNIIFLGDSFTYGLWLGDKDTIPYKFEQLARKQFPDRKVNVANFGWVSSSPLLSLRLLKDIGKKYKPDLIIQLIDMTDVGDDIYYDAIINNKGIYGVGKIAPTTTLLLQKAIREHTNWDNLSQSLFVIPRQRYFIVEQPLSETRYGFDFMRQHLDATYEYARDNLGAGYMMFVIPRYFQYSPESSPDDWEAKAGEYSTPGPYSFEPFRYFLEMRDEVPYPVYSMLSDFQNYAGPSTVFPNDAHLNATGTSYAAKVIFAECMARNCFVEGGPLVEREPFVEGGQ